MKIYNGFISNSSSASYIIKINMKLYEFINVIYNEFNYNYFNVTNIIRICENKLSEYEKFFNDKSNKKSIYNDIYKNKIDKIKLKIDNLNKIKDLNNCNNNEGDFIINKKDAIIWILKNIYSINLNVLDSSNVELVYETIMHNSYEDVPELIKSILTYFDFEFPHIKKECKLEKNNNNKI